MGIGFQPEAPSTSGAEPASRIVIPKSAYGLSTRQIAALGISDPDVAQRVGPIAPVRLLLHRASVPHCLSSCPVNCSLRRVPQPTRYIVLDTCCHSMHFAVPENARPPAQASLRAKAFYVGDEVEPNQRIATRMAAGTGAAPGQAPPDLPSLLLDGRICYIGMPVRCPRSPAHYAGWQEQFSMAAAARAAAAA